MPFIDRTYFVVERNIPKTDDLDVQQNLDALIQKRETELLRDLLAYPLYKAFIAGLSEPVVDAKWTALLLGGEYTDRFGNLQYWRGLVSAPPALINATTQSNRIPVVADVDAVSTQTIAVPVNMVLRLWTLEKRAIGPLRDDEFSVSEDGESVAFSTPVALNDTYWFVSNDLSLEQSTGDIKESLIADFVYYWYLRMSASKTVALGEVVSIAENSVTNGPAAKQQRAWNEMVKQIYELINYLDNSRSTYPEWKWNHKYYVFSNYKAITRW